MQDNRTGHTKAGKVHEDAPSASELVAAREANKAEADRGLPHTHANPPVQQRMDAPHGNITPPAVPLGTEPEIEKPKTSALDERASAMMRKRAEEAMKTTPNREVPKGSVLEQVIAITGASVESVKNNSAVLVYNGHRLCVNLMGGVDEAVFGLRKSGF